MIYTILEIQDMLREKQTGSRFVHTLGVQYTSACLAMRYGADVEKAQMAGLLHDCAKHMKPEKLLEKSRKHHLEVTHAQERNPFLLHGRVGAYVARTRYGVTDPEILGAVEWHTTGKPDMTLLEKIVFTADYIEPSRDKAPNLSRLRQISFEDLDQAVYEILAQTLDYLKKSPQDIDETTEITYSYYKSLLKRREKNTGE
ncbi:putative HD superfamily hydrolase involved in NAD metabolism [Catenibacillus scindens]|uniref:bis(5'-nucleosyl)-tetraphosphatase (symmetrical) n=1 Tax=Catenibacillus scindens TaxID=673271 RepID=A0A7W8H8M7_9FIRM|nr:bis(5'-nucleosyl)-tetraphosphatase (symmetrical) YqeK [Catenibacillus scindens]MBB5263777.1 putative HD superfamily hydrolase involved in NAD metabolism [Catenibacillus scindens]